MSLRSDSRSEQGYYTPTNELVFLPQHQLEPHMVPNQKYMQRIPQNI